MGPQSERAPGDRPLVWAHRGASADAPENTLAAFSLAERLGADGIELDVQRCATGEVVVFHDATLGRTAGRPGLLTELGWSALRAVDVGARFSPRFTGERIPLLADVLLQTSRSLLVNVELKCEEADDRGLTAAAIRIIRDAGAEERVLLSSFSPACLFRARALAPRIPRAHLFEAASGFPLRGAWLGPAVGAVALHPEARLVTPAAMRLWTRLGYRVNPWTVDDPDEARRLAALGCKGVITNAPDRVRAALSTEAPRAR
jgi:glycerophosphoryl diester phosphodiesterase